MCTYCRLLVSTPGFLAVIFSFFLAIPTVKGILCYECNSHYDPRCGDHFDNLTYPLTDCRYKVKHHLDRPVESHMCRKMITYIHGEKRIVRECAFLGQVGYNDGRWCLERVGTRYIQYSVCLCNNKDGCNAAPAGVGHVLPWFLLLSTSVFTIPGDSAFH